MRQVLLASSQRFITSTCLLSSLLYVAEVSDLLSGPIDATDQSTRLYPILIFSVLATVSFSIDGLIVLHNLHTSVLSTLRADDYYHILR